MCVEIFPLTAQINVNLFYELGLFIYLFFGIFIWQFWVRTWIYMLYLFHSLVGGIVGIIPESCKATWSSRFIHKIEPIIYAHKSQLELRHTVSASLFLHLSAHTIYSDEVILYRCNKENNRAIFGGRSTSSLSHIFGGAHIFSRREWKKKFGKIFFPGWENINLP